MHRLAACCLALFAFCLPASAEPVLKIINFTADWCPNCKILNPRMAEAVASYDDGLIEMVNLDMTNAGRRNTELERTNAYADAIRLAEDNQVGYLWIWYGGITGIAVVVAADNGEPITCFTRRLHVDDMQDRLKLALILAKRAPQGARKPDGPDCPPPTNY